MLLNYVYPKFRVVRVEIALLLVVGLLGCTSEPEVGKVSGKVTFKGQPVTEGMVNFFNKTQGVGGAADLDSSGSYSLTAPLASGEYLVFVTPPRPADPVAGQAAAPPKNYPNIPEKYRSDVNSPLTTQVEAGENVFDFDMVP